MIGPRAGIKAAINAAIAAGVGNDELGDGTTNPMATVARDATSGLYRPVTLAQLQTAYTVAGIPTALVQANTWIWTCDEAAGNLVDKVNGLAMAPNAAPAYQQSVAGQSSVAVKTTDATANQRFSSVDASLPDIGTESALLLAFVKFDAVGALRGVMSLGVTRAGARHTAASARLVANLTTTSGATNPGLVATRPWMLQHDETNSVQTLATDQDNITGVFDAGVAGKQLQIGGTDSAPATANYLWFALIKGAAAELTLAQRRTLLQTLGFAPAW